MIDKSILLASASPRRADLLQQMEVPFRVEYKEVEEIIPDAVLPMDAAEFLADLKGNANRNLLRQDEILIAADTVVILNHSIIGKPKTLVDAKRTLGLLSGNHHVVVSGVYISDGVRSDLFSVRSEVEMDEFSKEEIDFYVDKFRPLDKAGSYGIQDWIGWSKVVGIKGSYSNVLGLPTREVYQSLRSFM